jgi:GTP-binding protein EngB required for normal cell division
MSALPAVVPQRAAERDLSRRLDALAELVKIGKEHEGIDGVSAALIGDSEALLRRAGERLRLSGNHTVVALAGGTGSGKSTLFNTLSGATFSAPGVTRPTTRHVHACVWGIQGAGPLLEWLGIQRRHRYARASALDSGEANLNGLLLLDLPDHDSVLMASKATVDRVTSLADMLIFVLDPQKYADASVHDRYLIPLAGHAGVITVVLNQIDLLPPDQVRDCEQDLRRLLDAEGLHDTQVLPISAQTGDGLDALRAVLANVVMAQHAASERISADIDSLVGGFAIHAGGQVAPAPAVRTLRPDGLALAAEGEGPPGQGTAAGAGAAGSEGSAGWSGATGAGAVGAAASGMALTEPLPKLKEEAKAPWENPGWDDRRPLAAPVPVTKPPWEDAKPEGAPRAGEDADPVAFVPGGPAAILVEAFAQASGITALADTMASAREGQAIRLTGWPAARIFGRRRVIVVRQETGRAGPGAALPGTAQQSEVDNAITRFADAIGTSLPASWARSLREAARSGASQIPGALATSICDGIPSRAVLPAWWRLIAAWQWLLTGLAVAGVAWSGAITVGHEVKASSVLLSDLSLIPWLLITVVAVLLLGWLTASGCHSMALAAADREQSRALRDMSEQVAAVARALVLIPAGREIAEYERYRIALDEAQAPLAASG